MDEIDFNLLLLANDQDSNLILEHESGRLTIKNSNGVVVRVTRDDHHSLFSIHVRANVFRAVDRLDNRRRGDYVTRALVSLITEIGKEISYLGVVSCRESVVSQIKKLYLLYSGLLENQNQFGKNLIQDTVLCKS